MGKLRSKKSTSEKRTNPIGLPSAQSLEEDLEQEVGEPTDSVFVQTIMEQLQSHMAEERDSGLNSLSVACQNSVSLEEILSHDIFKTAGPLLVDPSVMVRHSAAGSLRNMSSVSSAVCDLMISQDVMTPLVTLLKQRYNADWTPQQKSDGLKIDTCTETFIEAIYLLWNLCESNVVALKIFNREGLAQLICKCLNIDTYGIRVVGAVAQCLNTVTEDNSDALPNVGELEVALEKILSSSEDCHYLKTLAVGILLNLKKGHISQLSPTNMSLTIKILSSTLDVDLNREISKFSSDVPILNGNRLTNNGSQNGGGNAPRGEEIDVKKLVEFDRSLEKTRNLISSSVLALEILSNVMFSEEDDEDDSNDEDSGESVEDFTDDMEETSVDSEMKSLPYGLPSEIYEGIVTHNMVDKVLCKIRVPPVNVIEILTENEEYCGKIVKRLAQLRCTALLCFQNLVVGLDFSDLGGFLKMKETWNTLGTTLLSETDTSNVDLIEAVTSAMRALMQKWVDEKCSEVVETMSVSDMTVFYSAYKAISVAKIHINLIKIIGGMGVLLGRKDKATISLPEVEAILGQVGEFLLLCVITPVERGRLWVISEVLDTIFDVFAEDDYNHIMKQLGMIEKLRNFLPQFRKHIQNQRRELGENKAVILTAKSNLTRFIDYKIKHGAA